MTPEKKSDWDKLPEVFGLLLAKADMALAIHQRGDTDWERVNDLLQAGVTHACEQLGIPRVSEP